jgi:hypothetical protein
MHDFLNHALIRSRINFWEWLGIPEPLTPSFPDLRHIQGALCLEDQSQVQTVNPLDPWNRPLPYPKVWLTLGDFFNLCNDSQVTQLGYFLIGLFLITNFLLLYRKVSFIHFCVFFSSSSLLAMQRGNLDILILFVILIWTHMTSQRTRDLLTIILFSLKIYPLFLLLIRYRMRSFNFILLLLLPASLILLPQLKHLAQNNQASGSLAYGRGVLSGNLVNSTVLTKSVLMSNILVLFFLGLLLVLTFLFMRNSLQSECVHISNRNLSQFLAGAVLYCSTFLIDANWDYRLILLILLVPFITSQTLLKLKLIWGICLILAMNSIFLEAFASSIGIFVNQSAKIALFCLCSVTMMVIWRSNRFFLGESEVR